MFFTESTQPSASAPTAGTTTQPTFNVTIKPDPVKPGKDVDFTLSGSVPFDINDDVGINIEFQDQRKSGETYVQPACKGIKGNKGNKENKGCLIKANTPFTLKAHKVPVPKELLDPYGIQVKILHQSGNVLKSSNACATSYIKQ